jgi:aminopeptidase
VDDPRVARLAELLVERCLDVQPGWQVTIRTSPLARPLVRELARAIARRGAYALPRLSWELERLAVDIPWALEAPLELLDELAPIDLHHGLSDDARLTIIAPEDANAGALVPAERLSRIQRSLEPIARRSRALEVAWCVVQFPTEAAAARAGMTLAEYEDFVYDACLLDWDAEGARMQRLADRFARADRVRIVGEGTDLTLSIAGRAGVVSYGQRNMPDGEFFFSPVEDSAEGEITFGEFPASYLGRDVEGVRLLFHEGRVVEASARSGEEFLLGMLDTDEGSRRLGELGIGCNPRITRHTRNLLFDEKLDGTVHLALGASYTYTGGLNQSAIHWDLVKDLRGGGELWCDGELVQRDGRWLI